MTARCMPSQMVTGLLVEQPRNWSCRGEGSGELQRYALLNVAVL